MPRPSDLDLFTFEDFSSKTIFDSALPSLPPHPTSGEFGTIFPFPSDVLLDPLPIQAVEQNSPLPLQTIPETLSVQVQPQATTIPPTNDVRDCFEGVTGAELWITGGEHSSVAVPATPQVRFTQCLS